ncbi:hypothetical protein AVEN_165744-1 [Araneus ventricosus]|uniref:DDE-1 domain-containing protein n=1 Tax=Araneus ventricosus TaxID=182803 RepID=A0A4Y2C452_ARAVE|nr:hypothetical protein AVEN_165744-1 [Araneus ventricosus]
MGRFIAFDYGRFFRSIFTAKNLFRTSSACPRDVVTYVAKTNGKGASSDKSEAEKFVSESKDYVEAVGFIPQQVFTCDESGLFWKKMPKRTCIAQEKKALQGHKPMENGLNSFVVW